MERRKPPPLFLEAFGRAVQRSREGLGWSQGELARNARLHRTYVSGVEHGQKNPTLAVIILLAEGLMMKPSDLVRIAEDDFSASYAE